MWKSQTSSEIAKESSDDNHRKRVVHILRYISKMQTNNGGRGISFTRTGLAKNTDHFFQRLMKNEEIENGGVLFSTYDFQRLTTVLQTLPPTKLPFSFYKSPSSSRKRTAGGNLKNDDNQPSPCWLRLIRSSTPDPPFQTTSVSLYLDDWAKEQRIEFTDHLLTLENLELAPATKKSDVKRFIRRYKKFLHQKKLHRILEPIYNNLFERYHQMESGDANHLDLIWGLGQAKLKQGETLVSGPLLEVHVEVELARDGALLVRPKQHTGVSINRDVLTTLTSLTTGGITDTKTRSLIQDVDALDPIDLSPGEPSTYTSVLKRIAVELSSGGNFQSSKSAAHPKDGQLVVTDAWCLYFCPRPSAVWARDALKFAETLSRDKSSQLPKAMRALTYGPGALEENNEKIAKTISSSVSKFLNAALGEADSGKIKPSRPHFPLPTSDAQNRIAELLLTKKYPAVVCEGPPGTGKTHTIANIVCAYLCLGKRVLVTSKGAPALSVLRERLPPSVQELCVDVSMSETAGMRQLQQTVERLANKVSWVNTERELSKAKNLEEDIEKLEEELRLIDARLSANAEEKKELINNPNGQELFDTSIYLIENAPWLMKTISTWDVDRVMGLYSKMLPLYIEETDSMNLVEGYKLPLEDTLLSLVASKAGFHFSKLKNAAKGFISTVPVIGNNISINTMKAEEDLAFLKIKGSNPTSKDDWNIVLKKLKQQQGIFKLCQDVLEPLISREEWPLDVTMCPLTNQYQINSELFIMVGKAAKVKKLIKDLGAEKQIKRAVEMQRLDSCRTSIALKIQQQAEELVACRVVSELSQNFSAEAQSALVKFAQVSGKAKFGRSSQPSKMTQRQRRKRQEYLDAFERCVRYIPCWILTSSQISDYLPSESLFDLVVIDEASQSDMTILPGMLRGKQWLIVGDGKQVSPTEGFMAEEQIEVLKAALPESPFGHSMLPGNSLFDLCAQAFPKGRVILQEHFRCTPEIISFSNKEFYNGNLIPLRLPTKSERLNPSLLDVHLPRGTKIGKINEQECDEIVRMISEYISSCTLIKKRSIGVISLVGDEQSRLIRGRILDSIGPHKYKLHKILVGEPPSFQGAERDIIFLSMVCSPGRVVTQSQLMYAQRINVALSRARDRMILVRSIDSNHIPNEHDIKFAVLDFFEQSISKDEQNNGSNSNHPENVSRNFRFKVTSLLKNQLDEMGFCTSDMGVVWDKAINIESATDNGCRAAICLEASGENPEEWLALFTQQKSIERVGWNCLRVDTLSFLVENYRVFNMIKEWLRSIDVHPENSTNAIGNEEETRRGIDQREVNDDHLQEDVGSVIAISIDDEEDYKNDKTENVDNLNTEAIPNSVLSGKSEIDSLGGEVYGNIVDLDFLQRPIGVWDETSIDLPSQLKAASRKEISHDAFKQGSVEDLQKKQRAVSESARKTFLDDDHLSTSSTDQGADVESFCLSRSSKSSKRRRTRLDKYSRDGCWYNKRSEQEDDVTYDEYIAEVQPEAPIQQIPAVDTEETEQGIDSNPIRVDDDPTYEE